MTAQGYDPSHVERKWQEFWIKNGVFRFDPDSSAPIFSIDTPPPTVSGKMHLGHAFSYAQQDFVARYKRMRGFNVFYPFGTDDNGVATERLIERTKNVQAHNMKREEFVKLCLETLDKELRPRYLEDWKRIGMSCDWSIFYTTIDRHSQRVSQESFIDLYMKGREYRKDAPTMWCPECRTGISQVELKDKESDSTFNDIVFKVEGNECIVATTRPELLPACVALFFAPGDERYAKLKGRQATVPLFGFEVSIMEDERVDPEKGTGIVMCCTFGDQTDMEWQKAYGLEIKMAIDTRGHMTDLAGKYEGLHVKKARKQILDDLDAAGLLKAKRPIRHMVNTHERCGTEIEFIKSKQWFVKYLDLREDMLKWGAKLKWFPPFMKVRFDNWVKGLQWDWLISRQRFFGVPFPVWYCAGCDEVILARKDDLPVDPLYASAPVKKCPQCKGSKFVPETDVMDTWATSSLTPQISAGLFRDRPVYKKLFPMSLRPQAHDIITFWLFNTVVKSNLQTGKNPFRDVIISGHAQDPHGKKMSKSVGNIVEPQAMIEKFSADALRFWAATSKLGDDLPFQEKDLLTGMKTVVKLYNATKFVFMQLEGFDQKKPKLTLIDRALLSKLQLVVDESTAAFEEYEYSRPKFATELFFYQTFCDQYLELVKDRFYNESRVQERKAAQYVLYNALYVVLQLFAPIMPHITEELYQEYYRNDMGVMSIHVTGWPKEIVKRDEIAERIADVTFAIIDAARKFKSVSKVSLKTSVRARIAAPLTAEEFEQVRADLVGTIKAESLEFSEAKELACEFEIAK